MSEKSNLATEVIHKEIDLVQSCITRMANNSFFLKGWFVSLIAVILTVLHEKFDLFILMGILAIIDIYFWYLDAFFLRTEKMYRKLYDWILVERLNGNSEYLYNLNPNRFGNDVSSVFGVMISNTLRWFYGIPLLLIIITTIYNSTPICCYISKIFK